MSSFFLVRVLFSFPSARAPSEFSHIITLKSNNSCFFSTRIHYFLVSWWNDRKKWCARGRAELKKNGLKSCFFPTTLLFVKTKNRSMNEKKFRLWKLENKRCIFSFWRNVHSCSADKKWLGEGRKHELQCILEVWSNNIDLPPPPSAHIQYFFSLTIKSCRIFVVFSSSYVCVPSWLASSRKNIHKTTDWYFSLSENFLLFSTKYIAAKSSVRQKYVERNEVDYWRNKCRLFSIVFAKDESCDPMPKAREEYSKLNGENEFSLPNHNLSRIYLCPPPM